MKNPTLLILLVIAQLFALSANSFAQEPGLDTVKTGIYITSIHDIDFREKEYTIDFWLWLKYKNREFNFVENLEIPQAKSV